MTALVRSVFDRQATPLTPRANWGRWLVDCPRCTSALEIDPENGWWDPRRHVFQARSFFECWDCGWTADTEWPPDELVASAERLLMMRPDPKDGNFDPKTETLHDLAFENGSQGIFDHLDQLELSGGPVLLTVGDGGIRNDLLPAVGVWTQHDLKRQITAG